MQPAVPRHDEQTRRLRWPARLYLWATRRLYNELAWAYDPVSWLVSAGAWATWRRVALEHVGMCGSRPPCVLEVAFGTGELLVEMARRRWGAYGLELSPAMQRVTARKLDRNALAVPRVLAPAQRIPFRTGTFDAVLSTFPANYILDPQAILEIARVLRAPAQGEPAGGRLVVAGIWVTLKHPALRRLAPLFYGAPSAAFTDYWQATLAQAGLRSQILWHEDRWVRMPVLIAEKGRAP